MNLNFLDVQKTSIIGCDDFFEGVQRYKASIYYYDNFVINTLIQSRALKYDGKLQFSVESNLGRVELEVTSKTVKTLSDFLNEFK